MASQPTEERMDELRMIAPHIDNQIRELVDDEQQLAVAATSKREEFLVAEFLPAVWPGRKLFPQCDLKASDLHVFQAIQRHAKQTAGRLEHCAEQVGVFLLKRVQQCQQEFVGVIEILHKDRDR